MGETRRLLPREERRAQILRAAARAFADGGYAATSMEDVAAEAGVTKLIVYRHFDSKEELYRAVLDGVTVRLRDERDRRQATADGRGASVESLLTVARDDPHGYRLLVFHVVREPQFEKQARGYWEEAIEQVDQALGPAVRDQSLRPWVVRSVMSYLLHTVLLWLETGDPARDVEFVAAATDGLHGQLRAWTTLDPGE